MKFCDLKENDLMKSPAIFSMIQIIFWIKDLDDNISASNIQILVKFFYLKENVPMKSSAIFGYDPDHILGLGSRRRFLRNYWYRFLWNFVTLKKMTIWSPLHFYTSYGLDLESRRRFSQKLMDRFQWNFVACEKMVIYDPPWRLSSH